MALDRPKPSTYIKNLEDQRDEYIKHLKSKLDLTISDASQINEHIEKDEIVKDFNSLIQEIHNQKMVIRGNLEVDIDGIRKKIEGLVERSDKAIKAIKKLESDKQILKLATEIQELEQTLEEYKKKMAPDAEISKNVTGIAEGTIKFLKTMQQTISNEETPLISVGTLLSRAENIKKILRDNITGIEQSTLDKLKKEEDKFKEEEKKGIEAIANLMNDIRQKQILTKVQKEIIALVLQIDSVLNQIITKKLLSPDSEHVTKLAEIKKSLESEEMKIKKYIETGKPYKESEVKEFSVQYKKLDADAKVELQVIQLLSQEAEKKRKEEEEKKKEKPAMSQEELTEHSLKKVEELIQRASQAKENYANAMKKINTETDFYGNLKKFDDVVIVQAITDLTLLKKDIENKKTPESTLKTIEEKEALVTQIEKDVQKRINVIDILVANKPASLERITKLKNNLTSIQQAIASESLKKEMQNIEDSPEKKDLQKELKALRSSLENTTNALNELQTDVENDKIVLSDEKIPDLEPDKTFQQRTQTLTDSIGTHTRKLEDILNRLKTLSSESIIESADDEDEQPVVAPTEGKKHHIRTRIYSDNPSLAQLASKIYLSSEERYHVKHMTQSYLDMIDYIEQHYEYAKRARNNYELKKMQAKCIHIQEVLEAYRRYLQEAGKYDGQKANIIESCLFKLANDVEPKGLLVDDNKLGPNATTNKISSLSGDVFILNSETKITKFREKLTDWRIVIPEIIPDDTASSSKDDADLSSKTDKTLSLKSNPEDETKPKVTRPYHLHNTFTTRYTHMVTNEGDTSKQAHYVTLQTEENGKRVAKFYIDNTISKELRELQAKNDRTSFVHFHIKNTGATLLGIDVKRPAITLSIPSDEILAWAITQVEDYLQDNDTQNGMTLTGELGEFTEDHVEAIMLYAAYKREVEGSDFYIKQDVIGIEQKNPTSAHVGALIDRLKNADLTNGPFKNLKTVVGRVNHLSPGIETPKRLMEHTDTPVNPVTYVSKPVGPAR